MGRLLYQLGRWANNKDHTARVNLHSAGLSYLNGGNFGIGTPSPGAQLDLSTDSARKLTTTTWITGSDIRLKKEIRPFTDGLDVISRINPVWFKWNGKAGHPDDGKDNIGVIG